MAVLCLLLAAAGASACWYGNWRASTDDPSPVHLNLARAGRVLVPTALIGWVLVSGAIDRSGGPWLVVALAFSLIGAVARPAPSATAFLTGLGAFALAQLAFISAFVAIFEDHGFVWWMALLGLVFAAVFLGTAGRRIQDGAAAREGIRLGYGVLGYLALLTVTATVAGGSGRWLLLLGALLFVVSDTVFGLDRFVAPRAQVGLVVMAAHQLALAGFTFGIAA